MSFWTWLFGPKPSPIPPTPVQATPVAPALPVHAVGDAPRPVVLDMGAGPITADIIAKGFPRCREPAQWAAAFNAAFARVGGFNRLGMACILAKANTEAKGLTRWDEDLYYTTPEQVVRMHGARAVVSAGAKRDVAGWKPGMWLPASVKAEVMPLLRNPKALGDRVYAAWGGYEGRGLGTIQLTTLANHQAFAASMGMSLADARTYMQTIPGAAMTAPWYVSHFGGLHAANRGDMLAVMRLVAGRPALAPGTALWASVHGDQQMADYERFRGLLGAPGGNNP